jgi:diguanylate cyclase
LQQSRVALARLTQALAASERHSVEIQRTLEALAETNSYLRGKLAEVERKVVMANHLAYHDTLTGLPNRRLLLDRLTQVIAQAERQNRRVALVFFDVDGFKAINDRFGHAKGDKVLQEVARRLSACLRVTDTACRYGGDEFIVMLPEVEGGGSLGVVERKIRRKLAEPYLVDGATIAVTLSMGTAIYPEDAKDHDRLIKLADAAMYSVKTDGGAASGREEPAGSAPSMWGGGEGNIDVDVCARVSGGSALPRRRIGRAISTKVG